MTGTPDEVGLNPTPAPDTVPACGNDTQNLNTVRLESKPQDIHSPQSLRPLFTKFFCLENALVRSKSSASKSKCALQKQG